MSLKTKLIPVLASLGATATMVPCLTSCGGLNLETHNMLNGTYYNHVLPCLPKKIYVKADKTKAITDSYLNDVKLYPNILKDDLLYTYSKIVPATKTNESFPYDFTKYYLYVQDFKIEERFSSWDVNFSIIIDMAAKIKQGQTDYFQYKGKNISEFDLKYTVYFKINSRSGFDFQLSSQTETDSGKNKTFCIALPLGVNDDAMATSIAMGYIKLPGSENKEFINDNETIDTTTITDPSNDPTSLVFYRNFFRNIAELDDDTLPLESHYHYNVEYVISQ